MRDVIFWTGFTLIFGGGMFAGPASLPELLMKEASRMKVAKQLGTGAMIAGGVLVLLAWLI